MFASGHAGPRKKSLHHTALRGGVGDLSFFHPTSCPVLAVSGALILLPLAKLPFWGPVFCGTQSGAQLFVVNFMPEIHISSACNAINIYQIPKDSAYL